MVRVLLLLTCVSLPALADDYLVAAVGLPAGSTVTAEVLTHKLLKTKVTGAVTPNDASLVVNQRLSAPLRKGDLLMWFAFSNNPSANERCTRAATDAP